MSVQDLELRLMSSRAAVAGFKKCSWVHIDKSIYDFVHHADSVRCSHGLQVLKLELCDQCRDTRGRVEVVNNAAS